VSDYFFDSSALLKRYYTEQGTNWVASITIPQARNSIAIAQITPVEIMSGLQRRRRAGQISLPDARITRLLLDAHVLSEYKLIPLSDIVIARAKDLVSIYPLRAYDAVQLASALEALAHSPGAAPLTFVSADTRLLAAAAAEGLATDDPNAHP
jgi:predicted nucleic acid-binding protein